jgi:hypothetical protein
MTLVALGIVSYSSKLRYYHLMPFWLGKLKILSRFYEWYLMDQKKMPFSFVDSSKCIWLFTVSIVLVFADLAYAFLMFP